MFGNCLLEAWSFLKGDGRGVDLEEKKDPGVWIGGVKDLETEGGMYYMREEQIFH